MTAEQIGDKIIIRPRFGIGQRVFHIAPESEEGAIVDWVYRNSAGLIYYTVGLGFDKEVVCLESELSLEKTF